MRAKKSASLLFVAAILVTWQTVSGLHLVSDLFLPGPMRVLAAFKDTFPDILFHAAATLLRALAGLLLGSVLGLCLGLSMTVNDTVRFALDPIVESFRPVPAIAAIPFFILWFGTGTGGQILLICLSCATVLAVDVFHAVGNISSLYIRAAQSMGASRWTIFRTVIVPAIMPALTPALRIISALAFSIAVASEFMGAQWGLGFVIMRARRTLETQTILLGMILIGILARGTDLVIRRIMSRVTSWTESSVETLQAQDFKESLT